MRTVHGWILATAIALTAAAPVGAQSQNPRQAAWLKNEIKNAQQHFVDQVAAISGVPAAKIRRWVPADGRDVAPKLAVLPALERARGAPLTEEQREKILAADRERYQAIERAKRSAAAK